MRVELDATDIKQCGCCTCLNRVGVGFQDSATHLLSGV